MRNEDTSGDLSVGEWEVSISKMKSVAVEEFAGERSD